MLLLPNLVRGGADARDIIRFEQRRAIVDGQPITANDSIQNGLDLGVRHRL